MAQCGLSRRAHAVACSTTLAVERSGPPPDLFHQPHAVANPGPCLDVRLPAALAPRAPVPLQLSKEWKEGDTMLLDLLPFLEAVVRTQVGQAGGGGGWWGWVGWGWGGGGGGQRSAAGQGQRMAEWQSRWRGGIAPAGSLRRPLQPLQPS